MKWSVPMAGFLGSNIISYSGNIHPSELHTVKLQQDIFTAFINYAYRTFIPCFESTTMVQRKFCFFLVFVVI